MLRFSAFLICCAFSFCTFLPAQESVPFAQTEAEAAELGTKNKAFMEAFTAFRELNKKLTALKVEYQDAKADRQKEIDAQYPGLYKQGLESTKNLTRLALDAHDETPNQNPFVINLLYSTVGWEFNRENYEAAYQIFKRLVASGIAKDTERYYVFGGLAALLTMNYSDAEPWLKIASESGNLEKTFTDLAKMKAGMQFAQSLQNQLNIMPETKNAWVTELALQKSETEAGTLNPEKKLPRVELTTSKGKIVLELFENEAPNTVANFITLVEKGYYDGTPFHRVLPGFMAQGGDPSGTGRGGPGYTIDDECGRKFPNMRKHFRGSISMANAGPDTNGSQFFLTFVPTSFLNGRHTVFGRIVEGIEILADIQRIDPEDEEAKVPEIDKIVTAKVLNKRNHPYEVKKNGSR